MKFNHIGTRFTCRNGNRGTIVGFAGDRYIVNWDYFGAKLYIYLIDEVDSEWEFLRPGNDFKQMMDEHLNTIHKAFEIAPKDLCGHTWKAYHGLSEAYEFCIKCDEKRE